MQEGQGPPPRSSQESGCFFLSRGFSDRKRLSGLGGRSSGRGGCGQREKGRRGLMRPSQWQKLGKSTKGDCQPVGLGAGQLDNSAHHTLHRPPTSPTPHGSAVGPQPLHAQPMSWTWGKQWGRDLVCALGMCPMDCDPGITGTSVMVLRSPKAASPEGRDTRCFGCRK